MNFSHCAECLPELPESFSQIFSGIGEMPQTERERESFTMCIHTWRDIRSFHRSCCYTHVCFNNFARNSKPFAIPPALPNLQTEKRDCRSQMVVWEKPNSHFHGKNGFIFIFLIFWWVLLSSILTPAAHSQIENPPKKNTLTRRPTWVFFFFFTGPRMQQLFGQNPTS